MTTTPIVPDDLAPTMTVEQAAELLGVSRSSAYRAAANDEIPTIRIGRRLLVPTAKLLAMLGAVAVGATAEPEDPTSTSRQSRLSTGKSKLTLTGSASPKDDAGLDARRTGS